MNDLIAKLEAADGPDRALDAAIYVAAGFIPKRLQELGYPVSLWAEGKTVFWKGGTVTCGPAFKTGETYPSYTESIDAAMTLVPKGWAVDITAFVGGTGDARLWQGESCGPDRAFSTRVGLRRPCSPAVAICISALKALGAPH